MIIKLQRGHVGSEASMEEDKEVRCWHEILIIIWDLLEFKLDFYSGRAKCVDWLIFVLKGSPNINLYS